MGGDGGYNMGIGGGGGAGWKSSFTLQQKRGGVAMREGGTKRFEVLTQDT